MKGDQVKALIFDVFGTVVDWRSSVIREGERLGAEKGWKLDWAAFADEWRFDGYIAGTRKVREGELPWTTADSLHRL
jgi:2-haloacid dehalogenase